VFATSWFSYGFSSGYRVAVWIRPFTGELGVDTTTGSDCTFYVLRSVQDPYFGINVFALVVALVLRWYLRRGQKIAAAPMVDSGSRIDSAPKIDAPAVDAIAKIDNSQRIDNSPEIDVNAGPT